MACFRSLLSKTSKAAISIMRVMEVDPNICALVFRCSFALFDPEMRPFLSGQFNKLINNGARRAPLTYGQMEVVVVAIVVVVVTTRNFSAVTEPISEILADI